MAKRPSMCLRPSVFIPDDDCSECMREVERLREEMEECCDEVKQTLSDHDVLIDSNREDIDILLPLVSRHSNEIYELQECCEEVRPKVESIENRFSDYYTKSETYSQTQVDQLISQIETSHYEEVDERPATGESNVIYLLPGTGGGKEQWIYSNGEWVNIGSTSIDLSDYVRIDQIVDMMMPIGFIMIREDNINPASLYPGTTWQLIAQDRVLVGAGGEYPLGSTGGAATHNHTNPTTNGSSASNTGTSNANTGTPSNNTSGSTTLTAAQSGVPAHSHSQAAHNHDVAEFGSDFYVPCAREVWVGDSYGTSPTGTVYKFPRISNSTEVWDANKTGSATPTINNNTAADAAQGHTHTLGNHTHTLNNHSHSMAHTHTQGNTGDASSMQPHLAVNIWERIA